MSFTKSLFKSSAGSPKTISAPSLLQESADFFLVPTDWLRVICHVRAHRRLPKGFAGPSQLKANLSLLGYFKDKCRIPIQIKQTRKSTKTPSLRHVVDTSLAGNIPQSNRECLGSNGDPNWGVLPVGVHSALLLSDKFPWYRLERPGMPRLIFSVNFWEATVSSLSSKFRNHMTIQHPQIDSVSTASLFVILASPPN